MSFHLMYNYRCNEIEKSKEISLSANKENF